MFHVCMFLFSVMLFFILTPGIALTIPPKSSKNVVALVHALVFAIVWHFTHKLVWHATEGFDIDSYAKGAKVVAREKAEKLKSEKIKKAQNPRTTRKLANLMETKPMLENLMQTKPMLAKPM